MKALTFIFNLSFDEAFATDISQTLLPTLIEHLGTEWAFETISKTLYNISTFPHLISHLLDAELCQFLVTHLVEFPSRFVSLPSIALAVNLACEKAGAQLISEGENLRILVKRVTRTQDQMLMKLIRTLALHSAYEFEHLRLVPEIANLIIRATTHDFLVEALGIFFDSKGILSICFRIPYVAY